MTHEYTLLVNGTIHPGPDDAAAGAMAWAAGTILAIGSEEVVRSISRGDSSVISLDGATVIPLGPDDEASWPPNARLEVGGPADLAVLDADPASGGDMGRRDLRPSVIALVRGGHAVAGALPGQPASDAGSP